MKNLVDSILFGKIGIIHPGVISPKWREHAIRYFIEHQKKYAFPVAAEEMNNGELEKISTISITRHKEKLIFIIQVPLIEFTTYQLFELHPYPTQQLFGNLNGSAYIQPRAQYLILSREQGRYSLIPNIKPPSCWQTRRHHICKPNYPMYDIAMQPICEVSLLLNTVQNPHVDCDIRVSHTFNPYWLQLSKSKGWLYSLPREEILEISCDDNIPKINILDKAGVLYLNSGCTAKTTYAMVFGDEVLPSRIIIDEVNIPTIALNISELVPNIKNYIHMVPDGKDENMPKSTSFFNIPGSLSYDNTLYVVEQELHYHHIAYQKETLFYIILAIGALAPILLNYIFYLRYIKIKTTHGRLGVQTDEKNGDDQPTHYHQWNEDIDDKLKTLRFTFPSDTCP